MVLVVDPDRTVRDQVAGALERAGYRVRSCGTGVEALEAAAAEPAALVLVELQLPDVTGYELCRTLRETHGSGVRVFLMSGEHTASIDRVAALLIGADDLIAKPLEPNEIVARVHGLVGHKDARPGGRRAPRAGGLTQRELEVLVLLADGKDQTQIGLELGISPKTAATHIQHMLGKFEAHSRAQLVALAYKNGFMDARPQRRTLPAPHSDPLL